MPEQSQVEKLVEHIAGDVHRGLPPEEAASRLAQLIDATIVEAALGQFLELAKKARLLKEPDGIIDDDLESWYLGPAEGDKFWPAFKAHLVQKRWRADAIDSLDSASTKIVGCLGHPGRGTIRTRGLVVGHVQSGKTANYTAVIAKAADAGYRLCIVLSGMNNALRNQTQRRLTSDIISLNPEDWIALTSDTRDFRATENVNAFLGERQSLKVLGVIKKNSARLRRLRDWLTQAKTGVLQSCPVLIIDDEADEATPNSHPDPDERTAINHLLIELLRLIPKAAYIGYTATPFANLLIDPVPIEDLYPRDFIIALPKSADYFGPERIFGREQLDWEKPDEVADGLDMIRKVPATEAALLHPASAGARFDFVAEITPSLAGALNYFWLATAARHARGQAHEHSSMLIHTSQYAAVHDSFKKPVEEFKQGVLSSLGSATSELWETLRTVWETEQSAVTPDSLGQPSTSFEELAKHLAEVVGTTEVKVENGRSTDRIDYENASDDRGRIYIVIGGNVLSRGLTLEGLSVSFFIRTASAYDTLLQMGRWFGYRYGYADLPRIWMTEELRNYFHDLATVEREIRYDIDRYKNSHISPMNFGVRIREHPHLAITSKLKMQNAVRTKMSFAGSAVQTLVFRHTDKDWLGNNLAATTALISRIRSDDLHVRHLHARPHHLYEGVRVEHILSFLSEYDVHEKHVEMPASLMRGYIEEQNKRGRIGLWNVAVVTRADAVMGTLDLGGEGPVNLINRARFNRGDRQFADIKALMSQHDPGIDMDISSEDIAAQGSRPELLKLRDQLVPDRGLLLLYPISKDSVPNARSGRERERLEAADHIIGIAVVFPDTADGTPQAYWTANVPDILLERAEIDDLIEAEADL
jgi:hypothetical protein